MNSFDELKKILSNQLKTEPISFKNTFSKPNTPLEQNEIKTYYIQNTASLLESLEIMHTEKMIDTEQFNSRVSSLLNIIQLVEEVTSDKE